MQKTQPALRILGEKVRYFRKLKGLSQAELAKGICTQATISLIEKRNKVPSMNILLRLINRLGISLDDIVVENHNHLQRALNEIDGLIRHGDYKDAAEKLGQIRQSRLTSEEDTKRYFYYEGMVELFVNRDQDEAIYYFGRVLNPLTTNYRDLPAIMATLGLGLAYAEKGTTDRARVYIDEAMKLLKQIPLTESRYLDIELTIFWHIARIYFELGEYTGVLQHVQNGIAIAVKHDSLFLLDELYALRARALAKISDATAPDMYKIALALARVTQSETLVQLLEADLASA
ncbi:helix-turn-helix transcriptional regulator [Lacticaseibacillus daqingensis]|uniref:helix-turn-helix transcriptional regulator n=1 Tax=Lacticaseibacillus daqingensis TaxID=2486014 RepID=UPI000F7AFE68|nr:helix-turn-helix transcriptional regulator [Lacticaseibacillus daqingensis]